MLVTITEMEGRYDLYFWEQLLTGVEANIYNVSQKSMDLISTCSFDKVQNTIKKIMETEEFVRTI